MAKCAYCGSTVVIGGRRDGDLRFCNDSCHASGVLMGQASEVPQDLVERHVKAVHSGACPKCKGPGPVDIHTSYTIWSIFVLTRWQNTPRACCRGCGIRSNIRAAVQSFFLGWWGVPWGVIMTPVQVVRNIIAAIAPPDPSRPSKQLETILRLELGARVLDAKQKTQAST